MKDLTEQDKSDYWNGVPKKMQFTEDRIHMAIVANLQRTQTYFPLKFSHIANQGRSPQEGAKLKKLGVMPGMPDLILYWSAKPHYGHGMLEIKAPGGKLSPAQKDVKQWCQTLGVNWGVAHNVDDAMAIFKC